MTPASSRPVPSASVAAAPTPRRPLDDPWIQGAISGLLTLMPARRWPRAVRVIYLWGPTLLVGGGLVATAAVPERVAARVRGRLGKGSQVAGGGLEEPVSTGPAVGTAEEPSAEEMPGKKPAQPLRRVLAGLTVGIVVGGAAHGVARFSLWADDAAERGLRRLGVGRPRAVLAIAAGVSVGAMTVAENRAARRHAVTTTEHHAAERRQSSPASSEEDAPSS